MDQNRTGTAQRALHALQAVLPERASVEPLELPPPFVGARVNGRPLRLLWLAEGSPGRVDDVLSLVERRRGPDVLVARSMSPGARQEAARAGVGWIDESGAAEMNLDWLIVARDGVKSPVTTSPKGWTPATIGVAEAVLVGIKPTVDATSHATGLSIGLCARALAFFTRRGFLQQTVRRGPLSAHHLLDPDRLLAEYADSVASSRRTEMRVGVLWRDPVVGVADLGQRWDAAGIAWAATGTVAGAVMAPHLTDGSTAEVFVHATTPDALATAAQVVSAKPAQGGRLVLRPFPSSATARLSSCREGMRLAPWPRVYADLRSVGVRGPDAADHLREVMQRGGSH